MNTRILALVIVLLILILGASLLAALALHRLVAAAPPPTGPPRLVFETDRVALGRLDGPRERAIEVGWWREGPGPLEVLALKTGCGCAVVEGLPDVLPTGARGRLVVRYVGGRRVGPLTLRVRAVTNAPAGHDVTDVRITGFVEAAVRVRPARLDLGRRTAGASVERELALTFAEDVSATDVRVRVVGATADAAVEPVGDTDPLCRTVRVRFDVPVRVGRWNAVVEIDVGGAGIVAVPVAAEVVAAQPGSSSPPRDRSARTSGTSLGKTSKQQTPKVKASGGP